MAPEAALNILLLGIQGSGKGTQAKRIAAEYGIPHVSTGELLRSEIDRGTELGQEVDEILARGDLVPDETMIELIRPRLAQPDTADGFVLDGYPRTIAQAEALDDVLDELGKPLSIVFELQVPDEVARERLLERARQEERADDTPEAIDRRIDLYHRETEPIVSHYRGRGNLVGIHGTGTVDEVFAEIADALEQTAVRQ
jgi:adenylate kinase